MKRRPILDRFWEKINMDGPESEHVPGLGPCWLWTAATDFGGYGKFQIVHGQFLSAHRFAYELLEGPIAPKMTLDHLCLVRRCCRNSHLEPVTAVENLRRADSFGKINRDKLAGIRCQRGHLKDGANRTTNWATGGNYCLQCANRKKKIA